MPAKFVFDERGNQIVQVFKLVMALIKMRCWVHAL